MDSVQSYRLKITDDIEGPDWKYVAKQLLIDNNVNPDKVHWRWHTIGDEIIAWFFPKIY